ncbi:ABC transporter ATP-binding protein [Paracoccus sp. M683]|uniref:ABC transporter ATP-binding protein n=1 Tax=Paracoccus sp. M683 TaxID=2594268 RepID=UPI00117E9DD9|nr:ABC transporter ATP-binding protein [Paracoccus sp. M683]TRW99383.1 ABC transporter ATP-binding protein [Paracoccus sp. M683]
MTIPTPPLETRELGAGYGGTAVLKQVSLLVAPQRMTVLAGPNGSGKSTLLTALARLLRPQSGAVLLDGQQIASLPTRAVAQRLGLLPQNPLTPEGLTVQDLVARGRYPHQGFLRQWSKADEAAVTSAMRITGTTEFADRPVESLSGGQRQRVWIAMALAQETGIVLLDEPTTYLDLRYQVEVMELLASLVHHHGRTIVTVLHDLNFALQFADRIAFLKDGQLARMIEDPTDCDADLVRAIFGTEVVALRHPRTGLPVFVPAGRIG